MRPVRISTSDASGGAVASSPVPLDLYLTPFNVSLEALVTGTANYDVQFTEDDVFAAGYVPASGHWTSLAGITGATTSQQTTLVSPVTAVRILQNSGNGSVALRILQAGVQ